MDIKDSDHIELGLGGLGSTSSVAQSSVVPAALEPAGCAHPKRADFDDRDDKVLRPQGQADSGIQAPVPTGQSLTQQGCSCGGSQPPQLVYALGSLWFDFGTEARHDLFVQQMGGPLQANNPAELIAFLQQNKEFAAGLTLILMQEQIPLYAVQPAGPFADKTYDAMFDALLSAIQTGGSEQRISLPGLIGGSTRLMNGMVVPVVYPDLRGMYKWQSQHLIDATRSIPGARDDSDEILLNFLNRVYYELRNLGVAPQDRAINFAATNAYQARQAFADAAARSLILDSIRVTKSPICRPDSDCWDVELVMFDDDDERKPNRVYRYTVDVSEVVPVTVGTVRSWAARA